MNGNTHMPLLQNRHERLLRIADLAAVLGWFCLTAYVLLSVVRLIVFFREESPALFTLWQVRHFLNEPDVLANLVQFFLTFLQGLVYTLVLLGVSQGLRMIVESDLNYRIKGQETDSQGEGEANDEEQPVFYNPQPILGLQEWAERLSWIVLIVYALAWILQTVQWFWYFFSNRSWQQFTWIALIILQNFFGSLVIAVFMFITLRGLAYILKILMETEFNSRGIK